VSKQEAKKIAEQFVTKHIKPGAAGVTDEDIKAAVNKVARALVSMSQPLKQKISA
jgi:hypothetical protein